MQDMMEMTYSQRRSQEQLNSTKRQCRRKRE